MSPLICGCKRGADVSQNAVAAGAVHRGPQRWTQWNGANRGVSGARVGRCAVGIGDPRVSLDMLCGWGSRFNRKLQSV